MNSVQISGSDDSVLTTSSSDGLSLWLVAAAHDFLLFRHVYCETSDGNLAALDLQELLLQLLYYGEVVLLLLSTLDHCLLQGFDLGLLAL